jgi:HPt (histidine-containing phosphotransfer) domain-containing protein
MSPSLLKNFVPVLAPARLQGLTEALGPEATERYTANFVLLLQARIERTGTALGTGDRKAAMDAALSLKTSSAMIGAARMEHLALRLENALRENDRAEALAAWKNSQDHASELTAALQQDPSQRRQST